MKIITLLLLVSVLALPIHAFAVSSGSTGADGAFNPTADLELQLPPDGIFNYTSVNIPAGVTVSYIQNAANTPVIMLVQGNVTIYGTIDISGQDGEVFSLNLGGPGGGRGGQGGRAGQNGQTGEGPGGGNAGPNRGSNTGTCGGAAASHLNFGESNSRCTERGPDTPAYGSTTLVPLLGGSGGGGGAGANNILSSRISGAGGGGGGAMLIAADGLITLNGFIDASAGNGEIRNFSVEGGSTNELTACGGSGSGGGVRLVASALNGTGSINVNGGGFCDYRSGFSSSQDGWAGSAGRVRFEANDIQFTGSVIPTSSSTSDAPGPLFVTNLPNIRITSIAGTSIAAVPTDDTVLPASITNPVTIEIAATDIPLASTLDVVVRPDNGVTTTVLSSPLAGTLANSTATASVTLPQGRSTVTASVNFTVAAANQMDYSNYAMGEPVEQIKVATTAEGKGKTTFVTSSGKEFTWPSNAIAMQ